MPVRQISPEELGHFGLDENHRLYWDDKAIQTESVVVLNPKQTFWGILIAIATIVSAVATSVYTWTYVRATRQTPPGKSVEVKAPESAVVPYPTPTPQTAKPTQGGPKPAPKQSPAKKPQ